MAEENRAAEPQAQAGDSTKTVMVLAIVLICILAVFMVTSLNKMKLELIRLNQQIDTLVTATGQNSLGAFQAVDKDGNLQFKFVPIPMEAMTGEGETSGSAVQ